MGRKAPRHRISVVHLGQEPSRTELARLRTAGFTVRCTAFEPTVVRQLASDPPAAIVIDLSRRPAAGRDIGVLLRRTKGTRHIPLVFVAGAPDTIARVQNVLPDAAFARWSSIGIGIHRAIRAAPEVPVIPDSALAGYAGTPLLTKLGIDAGTTVGLENAPDNIASILGRLPTGAVLTTARSNRDITLWFVTSRAALARRIARIARSLGNGKLWIAWPKRTSGVPSDLSQAAVRQAGLAAGLVDFKICAIDRTWSGLKFVRRDRGP
jgi:hypothetical protein